MQTQNPPVVFGSFALHPELRELRRDGRRVALRRRPLDLLLYLIQQRHRVVSKDELLDALWPGISVSEAALSSAMRDLRRALADSGRDQHIVKTYHGYGYRFVAAVDPAGRDAIEAECAARVEQALAHELEAPEWLDDPEWVSAFSLRVTAFVLREIRHAVKTQRSDEAAPSPARSRRPRGNGSACRAPRDTEVELPTSD